MSCFCPPGFSATPTNDECISVTTSAATLSATLWTATTGSFDGNVNRFGTIFYEDISQSNGIVWPIRMTANTGNFQTQNGTPLFSTQTWADNNGRILNIQKGGPGNVSLLGCLTPSLTTFGPQRFNTGVWGNRGSTTAVWTTSSNPAPPFNQWVGFSVCIDFPYEGTYYIGLAADDIFRFSYNNELVVVSSGVTNTSVVTTCAQGSRGYAGVGFHVFPITLNSGLNTIQVEGYNLTGPAHLSCEIYSATSLSVLTGITSSLDLVDFTIFSTFDEIGNIFTLAGTSGYTCPIDGVFVDCGTPECVTITRTACTGVTPTTSTTTTTTRSYINSGYIPVNDCNVLTIQPLNVICNVTNITGKPDSSNGSITLTIVGGVPPYTIEWTFPNGATVTGGKTINGLSTGSYTAVVTDYYGDYTFTTTCVVPGFTTTTTSTTTLPPVPSYLENIFCMSITTTKKSGAPPITTQITFQYNTYINGQTSWISNDGNEIVYFNPSVGTSGVWSLSASTSSIINTNLGTSTWTIFKGYPSSPTSGAWTMSVNPPSPQQQTITSIGACSDFLSLTINSWWALNDDDIPTTFKFSGGCGGSNETPWFKWYLLGGLTSSDISTFEIYCEDLDNPGYIHWNVTGITSSTTQVSNSIPWPGGVTINPTSGGPGAYNAQGWEGPCPPSGDTHTYLVTLTANLVAGGTQTSTYTFTSTT
jgi:phosphatidylethanolamine-binding protein (PEBP) family uncharacterized protein